MTGAAAAPEPGQPLPGQAAPQLGRPVPGQVFPVEGTIALNAGAPRTVLVVVNTGDRPVQVGSHFHFAQANPALSFDRQAAHGLRLDIPAGTAVRFEPGVERRVDLVPLRGARVVPGLTLAAPGNLDAASREAAPEAPADTPPEILPEA